ncbi:hypothetical protein [Hyalangium rubrum]|uniref:Gamma-glutamyltranspeptidase n=1 Tax=Hyalangium rubrum TaxID=3103134 RepID=A0ABU5H1A8_9BACT|nr:hypothetical protein [Hyalangium sp. s54d21]MDY7227190.1 hypothetical protein [Hyalangium sp. s54d21]
MTCTCLARLRALLLLWGVALATSCGPVGEPSEPRQHTRQAQGLEGLNGLSANGLSANGLSANGLSANGLSANGLSTSEFASWFQADEALADSVMRYVVRCALAEGTSLSYTVPETGERYTWEGLLGLAPGWASGTRASTSEQQVVSACLAAHVNKYGMTVPISVLGLGATGAPVPYTSAELRAYSQREACFFGNLFTSEGLYLGSDRGKLNARESTARACSLSSNSGGGHTDCPPLVHVGSCAAYCTLDASKTYYTACTYNGVTYRPLTTRLREEDVYLCGDGACQVSESCGTSNQYDNCGLDCGACP